MNSPKICIIGAGFSGLCAGIQLKKQLNYQDFKIIDRNGDFGGVWQTNTYPGSACDIFSHLYSLSFEPNPNWSSSFASQAEILEYIKSVANKYGLYSNALFNRNVQSLTWDETLSKWRVMFVDNETGMEKEMQFDIVINGQGRFSSPNIPELFLGFKGPIIHSGKWNDSTEINDKIVAVVGTSSSAAQIIPAIANKVKKLLVYQRHAAWVIPAVKVSYSSSLRWAFENIPGLRRLYRSYIYLLYERFYFVFRLNTSINKIAKSRAKNHLQQQITDESLREQLTPDYELGCKRIIPSSLFYPALNLPNVKLISSKISSVTNQSIITEDGNEEKLDLLILATGFEVKDHYGCFELNGKDGKNIHKMWVEDKPKAYLATMNSLAPNYFILLGPNTAPGYTSVLFGLECQVNWMIQVIKEMKSKKAKYVCVKSTVEEKYMKEIEEKMTKSVHKHPQCGQSQTWIQNSKGNVVEIFPFQTLSFWRRTLRLNPDDLEFK